MTVRLAARCALLVGLWASGAAAQAGGGGGPATGSSITEAQRAFERARGLYRAGDYRAAIEELREAVRLDPSGKELVYNLAILHEKLGELDAAIEHFRRYVDMEPQPDERARIEATIERLEGAKQARSDDPGSLAEWRDEPSASPTPAPTEPPARADAWVIGSGAVAATALVVGIVFGVRALARQPSDDPTGIRRSAKDVEEQQKSAHDLAVVADVSFAIALVAGATSATLFFTRDPSSARTSIPAPGVAFGGAF